MKLALLLSLCFFILFLILPIGEVYWDEAVYIGMGKYLTTSGGEGIYESIRPPLLPFVLGVLSFFGNPLVLGKVFIAAISATNLFVFYLLLATYVNRAFALLGSFLLGLTPVYLLFSGRILTGMFALLFVLLEIYMYRKEKYLSMSFFGALAFLARFPAGLFFVIVYLLSWKQNTQKLKTFFIFLGVSSLYFFLNLFLGYSPISSFFQAAAHQNNLAFAGPWWFYFFLFLFSPVLFAGAMGAYYALLARKYELLIFAIVPLLYFSSIPIKQERFFLLVLPFLLLLTIYGMQRFVQRENNYFALALVLILAFGSLATSIGLYSLQTPQESGAYAHYFEGKEAVVLSTSPLPVLYSESLFIPLYFSPEDALVKIKTFPADYILYSDDAWNCVSNDCNTSVHAIEQVLSKKDLVFQDGQWFIYSNQ